MRIPRHRRRSFTLLELIVVIAVLAIIIAVVIVSVDPVKRLNVSRNNRRRSDVSAIAQAAGVRIADQLPMTDITTDWRIIGTGPAGSCALPCSMIFDALHFNGNGAKIDAGPMPALNLDGSAPFAFSLWLKVDSYVPLISHDVLTKMESNVRGWRIVVGDGYPSFIIGEDELNRYVINPLIDPETPEEELPKIRAGGGYYHLVITYDGDATVDFYLNGVYVPVFFQVQGSLDSNTLNANAANLFIGGRASPSPGEPSFHGAIDEIRIYDESLDAGEVTTLYGKGDVTDGLVAHWNFDEGIGSNAVENVSSTSFAFTGPTWTQGISSITDTVCADLEEELVEARYLPILPINVGIPGAVPDENWTYYAIRRDGAAVEVKSCVSEGEGDGGSEPYPDISASR